MTFWVVGIAPEGDSHELPLAPSHSTCVSYGSTGGNDPHGHLLETQLNWQRMLYMYFPNCVTAPKVSKTTKKIAILRYLDVLLDHSLLVKKDIPREVQASEEAARVKKLMGSLRYLYRNRTLINMVQHFQV